jgi:GNAT superfamily N-acetyltransferase
MQYANDDPLQQSTWLVRPTVQEDYPRLLTLADQLGYPLSPDQIKLSLLELLERDDHMIYSAVTPDHQVVGWVHIFERPLLISIETAELGGLVVEEKLRGEGIGRALLGAAEQWAFNRGLTSLTVRSNVKRIKTKAFYLKLDYQLEKTSNTFKKRLHATNLLANR